MPRIFRHLRRDALARRRITRYLRYALGEILLVVIGIVIALQIDNWNDAKVVQRQNRESLWKLAADLRRDLEMIDPVAEQIRMVMLRCDQLADHVRERPLDQVDNAELYLMVVGLNYRPYAWNRAAIEQMKNSGALRQIADARLTDRISAYDALTHHLDQDFENDQQKLEQVELTASRIVDLNYPQRDEVNDWMDEIGDTDALRRTLSFRDTDLFRDMQALDLTLLTGDRKELLLLVNQAILARADLDARVDLELPRLRAWAEEIIATIEADYR